VIRRLRRIGARLWRIAKWPLVALTIALLLLLMPVGYVELACRGTATPQTYQPLLSDPASQRREANTYLTYPEWHIVYAYDGLAAALKEGDEHAFDYAASVTRFWSSTCALMRVADAHGGADWDTRSMIHTIGVSFAAEMALKAAYEETIGRATAWLRGIRKTPQDKAVAAMAVDYATFLRQTPWYQYPFLRERQKLWATPTDGWLRGWERRIGIGLEFSAKSAYAGVIAGAVAATAPAKLTIRSVVSGVRAADLARIPDVTVRGSQGTLVEIETPRYDLFTRILVEIARRNGEVREIAGNDDIMVTLTVPAGSDPGLPQGSVIIMRLKRDSIAGDRLLVDVKVSQLASLLRQFPLGDPGLEHVFDY
jgi:hypothetical protein